MLSLLIDHKPAIIKTGTTFKLTRVNPYFDTTGDYTFEVTLPLRDCPQNRAIFGHIDLPQSTHTPHIGQRHPMTLIAPPITLTGHALITSITESEVKVQLIAGTGALCTSLTDDEKNPLYIDKMDLGHAWDQFPEYNTIGRHFVPGKSIEQQRALFYYMQPSADGTIDPLTMAFGTYGNTDALCLPTYCEEDDKIFNPIYLDRDRPSLVVFVNTKGKAKTKHTHLMPQPYLLDILQRIIRAAGYTVGDWSAYTNNQLTNGLYIVNGSESISRADALPHWTLKELLTQVQNFLGATFTITDGDHTVNLIPRPNYYSAQHTTPISLTSVTDTHTTDIDQKATTTDNSAANITYKFATTDDQLILPEEVWQNAEVKELLSLGDIINHFNTLTDEEKAESRYLYHERVGGRTYAILHRADSETAEDYTYELAEVDICAPMLQNIKQRDNLTELKIVPARTVRSQYWWPDDYKEGPSEYLNTFTAEYAYPLVVATNSANRVSDVYNIDEAINQSESTSEDSTTNTDKDTIELAWYGGKDLAFYNYPITQAGVSADKPALCPIAIPYFKHDKSGFYVRPPRLVTPALLFPWHGPFSLSDTTIHSTLGSIGTLLTGAASIDTRVEHQVQFLDDIPLDPTATLLIAGRRYAIHRLEITITPTGIDPLKTAYLYEIH